jgi:UDP-glucose 4-epimerase
MQSEQTILVIGGTGFIGNNFIDFVLKQHDCFNFHIVVLSRKSKLQSDAKISYVKGDYGDKSILNFVFTNWNISKVFHFATNTIPINSNSIIADDINGNLLSTLSLLDVMNHFGCKYILFLSSGGAVYGNKLVDNINENTVCEPISSYGVVKLTIENYLRFYHKQFGFNYLILRVSNPFGKHHFSNQQGIINIAIRRALIREKLLVWGDGQQSKDYIFVDDLIKIILLLVKNNILNKTINVGSGKSLTLNSILFNLKEKLADLDVDYIDSISTDVKDFCLDISLLNSLIKIKFTDFNTAINETILWERQKIN